MPDREAARLAYSLAQSIVAEDRAYLDRLKIEIARTKAQIVQSQAVVQDYFRLCARLDNRS